MRQPFNPGSYRRAVLLTVFGLLAIASPFASGAPETPDTVTVVGRGELFAEPDQATITVGVQLYNESAQAASAELRDRMEAVIDAIRTLGIPERRIQTTNYSIFFERDYQASPQTRTTDGRPAGVYRVENMVRVSLDDTALAARTVETAIEAGANQLYGIGFSLSDPGLIEAQARELAMQDARERAEQLASLSGRSVGRVIEVTELVGSSPGYAEARGMAAGMGGGPVEPGATRYSASVQVTYELE
ncbi:MAG TPA: SIMPL domain-containing protein [Spirochaetia bacterium]|nr:SIMPL domain-containing protein [Spirochaetia bacterium]